MITFDRVHILRNEYSSNADYAKLRREEFFDAFPTFYDPDYKPIQTSIDDEDTVGRTREALQDGDILLVEGGDKTVEQAGRAALGLNVTVLPLWGGNGNDASHDLNGKPGARSMHEIITKGHSVAVHPVNISINGLQRTMLNYFELGCNAKGATLLNNPTWRKLPGYHHNRLRSAYEAMVIPAYTLASRRFTITEDDQEKRLMNLSIVHSHTAAKHATFPVSLTQERVLMTECATPASLAIWGIRAIRGNVTGPYLERGMERTLHLGSDTLCHIDAEPDRIERGSVVSLSLNPRSFNAVSTQHYDLAA